MLIKELEETMWEAAKNRDPEAFLEVVDPNAVMVCGGFRCTGREYSEMISEFDCAKYEISYFEEVAHAEGLVQVHYIISTETAYPENSDLSGSFHVTSTWKLINGEWKLVFNMDSKIFEEIDIKE